MDDDLLIQANIHGAKFERPLSNETMDDYERFDHSKLNELSSGQLKELEMTRDSRGS